MKHHIKDVPWFNWTISRPLRFRWINVLLTISEVLVTRAAGNICTCSANVESRNQFHGIYHSVHILLLKSYVHNSSHKNSPVNEILAQNWICRSRWVQGVRLNPPPRPLIYTFYENEIIWSCTPVC